MCSCYSFLDGSQPPSPLMLPFTFPALTCLFYLGLNKIKRKLVQGYFLLLNQYQTLRDSGVSLDTVRSAVAVKSGSPEFQGITLMMTSAVSSPRQATLLYFPGLLNMLMVLIEVN